jgi:hypothetical protein
MARSRRRVNEGFDYEGTSVRQEDLQELQDRAPSPGDLRDLLDRYAPQAASGLIALNTYFGNDVELIMFPRRMPRLCARLGAI